jgi:ribonuclease HI
VSVREKRDKRVVDVYIDGGCRGNPGEGAFGFVVFEDGKERYRFGEKIGICTNNVAEYRALIGAARYLLDRKNSKEKRITVYSDSELLVKQIEGAYRVRSSRLKPLFSDAANLIRELKDVRLVHVKREENHLADWIVNRVLDNKEYKTDL